MRADCCRRRLHALRGDRQPAFGVTQRAHHDFRLRHAGAQALRLRLDGALALTHEILRVAQALVAENARQELRALGRTHRRHHAELFLPGEIGVEELLVAHPEPAMQEVVHGTDRRRDRRRGAVEEELGVRQATRDEIPMSAQLEVELDFHRRARRRAIGADRLARAARGRHAVQRPRNALEDRRLAGAVRADDAGDAGVELDPRVDVLAEVAEPDAVDPHQASASTDGVAAAAVCASSRYFNPRPTKPSRSMSASSGRARSFSTTMSRRFAARPARRSWPRAGTTRGDGCPDES